MFDDNPGQTNYDTSERSYDVKRERKLNAKGLHHDPSQSPGRTQDYYMFE